MICRKEVFVLLYAAIIATVVSLEDAEESTRDKKLLPVFQVVRFPNDLCTGGTKNGTCYTSEECSSKGGTNDGSCASGFGVCCTFALACGGSASENNTYLVQSSVTTLTSPCTYTICPLSSNICRTRFDFSALTLADPVVGTVSTIAASIVNGNAIGDCVTDTMTITAPGAVGPPIICGNNKGYHMILDTFDQCHEVNFNIGGSTTTTRSWEIRVTQYACGQEDVAGWPGCLQYYTQTFNTVQNFGFPTSSTVLSTYTHLSNQKYDICIRRASGYCLTCYYPVTGAGTAAITQSSYGLGVSVATKIAQAAISTTCSTDFIEVPYANTAAIAALTAPGTAVTYIHRFCGRFIALASAATATVTICSRHAPFVLGVNFDDDEIATATGTDKAKVNEQILFPGGIVGFKLYYWQVAC